ncbi:hypothetical protein HPC49_19400 [Pyxidicoccus fallax]|uniref:Uncharacterized protein n=1 Tax=Pyxidicoccus fallax TaxID=394095 RepID=A0A848L669_9BACT|nr:hypothetical protein [Pyxidicoccus fallax]NMO14229.1 hypothetical protein [Pyxidicoccus fallax]NPC80379.1 hypothetical protein [Pyxidicoccus fallax]
MSIRGWACVRPDLYDYNVPSTSISVYYNGVSLPLLDIKWQEDRYDLTAAGVCAGSYRGFVVWVGKPTSVPATYAIYFNGPYALTPLEGQLTY